MNNQSNIKTRVLIIISILSILISFQNCSNGNNNSYSTSGVFSSSSLNAITEESGSQLLTPPYYSTTSSVSDILGSCTISNGAREIALTVIGRASRTDCSLFCAENRSKFSKDYVDCQFNGTSIVGGPSADKFLEKNHCTIESSDQGILVDDFNLDKPSCISQCQNQGSVISVKKGFSCVWQNQTIYNRDANTTVPTDLGTCNLSVTIPNPTNPSNNITIVTLSYSGSVTSNLCAQESQQLGKLFPKGSVTDSTVGFVMPTTPIVALSILF